MNPNGQLYPIIRRKRKPLIQVDEPAATVPSTPPQAPAAPPEPLPAPVVPPEPATESETPTPANHETAKCKRTQRKQRGAGA
jgi:hypothetical protein